MYRLLFSRVACLGALSFFLALAAPAARADTLAYWSFNGGNETPDINTIGAAMTVQNDGIAFFFSDFAFLGGTTVNAQSGYVAGVAPTDLEALELVETLAFTITNLDFTGYTDIELSFATIHVDLVSLFDALSVDYRFGAGFYFPAADLAVPTGTWSARSTDFAGVLDGQSDVTIRFTLSELLDSGAVAAFDNVTISGTPVPEPSTYALAGGLLALGMVMWRRRAVRA